MPGFHDDVFTYGSEYRLSADVHEDDKWALLLLRGGWGGGGGGAPSSLRSSIPLDAAAARCCSSYACAL